MVLNYIWIALFVIGVLVGVIKLVFMGDYNDGLHIRGFEGGI